MSSRPTTPPSAACAPPSSTASSHSAAARKEANARSNDCSLSTKPAACSAARSTPTAARASPRKHAVTRSPRSPDGLQDASTLPTSLAGLMADGLDVVAVGIEDVAAVVVGVVPAQAGCAVVGAACLDRCGVEGVHLRAALGLQRNVKPPAHRLPVGLDEERRSASIILAEPSRRSGELHQERESERRERLFIERLASLVVGNGEPDVIEHRHLLVFGGGSPTCCSILTSAGRLPDAPTARVPAQ